MHQVPLVLIDGTSYLYRAFHSAPPSETSQGAPAGAVKATLNMLQSVRRNHPGSPVIVAFDAPGKTFRHDLFEAYKSHCPSMTEDLLWQIAPLHACIRAQGLPLICVPGVEAEDVIATLALRAAAEDRKVVISTTDRSLTQIVNRQVTLNNGITGLTLDRLSVMNRFGVPPELMPDLIGLIGDQTDNIPGVPDLPEISAAGLLESLGSLEDLYEGLDRVQFLSVRGASKIAECLVEHRESAFLSRQLATIRADVPLPDSIEDLIKPDPQDPLELYRLYRSLEFNQWSEQLRKCVPEVARLAATMDAAAAARAKPAAKSSASKSTNPEKSAAQKSQLPDNHLQVDTEIVLSRAQLHAWVERLEIAPLFAFGLEVDDTDPQQAKLIGVSLATSASQAAYIPLGHVSGDTPIADQLDQETLREALQAIMEDPKRLKVSRRAKHDINVLMRRGIRAEGIKFDVGLLSYALDTTATKHTVGALAKTYLDLSSITYEAVVGTGVKKVPFRCAPLDRASAYAGEQVALTFALQEHLRGRLRADPVRRDIYLGIELPLVPVLARIEQHGALVDSAALTQFSQELSAGMANLTQKIYEISGETFNLASPAQLGRIMYDVLRMPILGKTTTGQRSTDEATLSTLAAQGYPMAKLVSEYRSMSKLKNTYTDRLPVQVNPKTGRIHTVYQQAVTSTARLSSTNPNLQNIPIRTAEGRRIRRSFIAAPGHKIMAADYSQIELRIMAHMSQDEGLIHAFQLGLDVHRATAAEVFGTPLDSVTDEQRRNAKAINFGLIYGMSAFGLAPKIGCEAWEAQSYMDRYFARYPGVQRYMERISAQATEQGYVETLFGRQLYLPGIHSKKVSERKAAARSAINAPMQGTSADIIKRAMISIDQWLQTSGLNARMILQVHDELVLEVAEDEVDLLREGLVERMSTAARLDVPLLVEVGVGNNWDEAH